MHLISFLLQASAPKVCAELVSSLTHFGCLGHLEVGNLICPDGSSPSDSPPWVEMLLPVDPAVLSEGAEWVCMMYLFQSLDFSSLFSSFFPCFSVSLEGSQC